MGSDPLESIKFAGDLTKQLITLSTAILTLTASYAKTMSSGTPVGNRSLRVAWGAYLASIVFGVWVLMALTGVLAIGTKGADPVVYESSIRWPAVLQILTFVAATGAIARYGSSLLASPKT